MFNRLLPPRSPRSFALRLIQELRRCGYEGSAEFDPENHGIKLEEGSINFGNIYPEYRRLPFWHRAGFVRDFANHFMRVRALVPSVSLDEARASLRFQLRDKAHRSEALLRERISGDGSIYASTYRSISAVHDIELCLDTPNMISSVGADQLAKWEITADEAFKIARDNIWRISNENFETIGDGVFRSPWRDSYDASRLALYDLIWQLEVDGPCVAMAPTRDLLLVTGANNAPGLLRMAALAKEALSEHRVIGGEAVQLVETQWQPFQSRDPEVRRALAECRLLSDSRDYPAQEDLLNAIHAKQGIDDCVIPIWRWGKQGTEARSLTCWPEGAVALLPRAELVGMQANGEAIVVEWDAVFEHCGDLLEPVEPMDLQPPRWRVSAFPAGESLAKLRACAVHVDPAE